MKYFFLFGWIFFPAILLAQTDQPLGTDRPGEGTDAASVVGAGVFQAEVGLFREWEREGNYTFGSYPIALLRYGATDRLEVRVSSGLFTNQLTAGPKWSPVDVSTKFSITEPRGWVPQMALLVGLTLPRTGSELAQSRFTQPRIVLLLNRSLNSWLGITVNLGAHWENDSPETIYRYAWSFDLSLSDRVGAFAEFYGDLPEASRNDHLFNSGFVFLINNNLQLDVAAGTALTAGAPDFYVGGGVAVRW